MKLRSKRQLAQPARNANPPATTTSTQNEQNTSQNQDNQNPNQVQNQASAAPQTTRRPKVKTHNDRAVELLTELFNNVDSKIAYTRALNKFIEKNNTFSKFKPVRRKFSRRKTKVHGPFNTYQIDLSDYQKIKYHNKRYGWILFIIDAFSRYGYCIPLKTKEAKNSVPALEKWLLSLNHLPKFIYSDDGKEFTSRRAKNLYKSRGITHFVLAGTHKASIVERFQRTIKTNLEMYFNENETKNWIDVLPKLVRNYNQRYNRAIGMAPSEVNYANFEKVYKRLYPRNSSKKLCKFSTGDLVRIAIKKKTFAKGYLQTFSNEIYKVLGAIDYDGVCQYSVQPISGGDILKKYYEELSLVVRHDTNTVGAEGVPKRRRFSA